MHSCIYEGTIRHRRFGRDPTCFNIACFSCFSIWPNCRPLFDIHPLWSYERPNMASFRRRDHFGDPQIPLDQAVRGFVEERLGSRPNGPIRLLTHLRYFGYCFNPASFYYCYDPTDTEVETIVVEIHNTPWGERHCYVLGLNKMNTPFNTGGAIGLPRYFMCRPLSIWIFDYDWRFRRAGRSPRST